MVDPTTGTVKVTLAVPEPPEGLRPGSFVKIRMVDAIREDARLIPKESVVRDLAESFVFVLDDSAERVIRKRVELGIAEGAFVEVTEGIDVGDKVVAVGQGGLRPRSLVRVVREREVPPASDSPASS